MNKTLGVHAHAHRCTSFSLSLTSSPQNSQKDICPTHKSSYLWASDSVWGPLKAEAEEGDVRVMLDVEAKG